MSYICKLYVYIYMCVCVCSLVGSLDSWHGISPHLGGRSLSVFGSAPINTIIRVLELKPRVSIYFQSIRAAAIDFAKQLRFSCLLNSPVNLQTIQPHGHTDFSLHTLPHCKSAQKHLNARVWVQLALLSQFGIKTEVPETPGTWYITQYL